MPATFRQACLQTTFKHGNVQSCKGSHVSLPVPGLQSSTASSSRPCCAVYQTAYIIDCWCIISNHAGLVAGVLHHCQLVFIGFLQVTEMLQKNQRQPPLSRNAAPHSGAVAWVRSLKERASGEPLLSLLPWTANKSCTII